jgi:hypothetical protein
MKPNKKTPVHCGSLFTWEGTRAFAHASDFDHDVADEDGIFMVRSHRTGNVRRFGLWRQEIQGDKLKNSIYWDGRHVVTVYHA